ncbi:MAG TPA: FMN-binding protein [Microbacteriaceae bacterium]|nr:FMN-binding protein [Microbacteriaceae bacterium]
MPNNLPRRGESAFRRLSSLANRHRIVTVTAAGFALALLGGGIATASTLAFGGQQVTGSLVQSPFGTVQVKVTIAGGKLTDTKARLTAPDGHSQGIDDYAAPILRASVLSAQSAKVNSVTGATYTSYAYLQSLQAALDKAHFAG